MIRYTRKEIDVIRNKHITFKISDSVLNIISSIVHEVGSPSYIKTPSFTKRKRKNHDSEESFDNGASSYIKKDKNILEEIQTVLNKISGEKTYEKLKSQLLDLIGNMEETEKISFRDVTRNIYEIASNQAYNVPLYARLYNDICIIHPSFRDHCIDEYNNHMDKFLNIQIVNPESDYDGFCKANRLNEQVRTISKFYSELIKFDILNIDHIMKLIFMMQDKLLECGKMDTPETNPCIEYSENIFVLVTGTLDKLRLSESWESIYDNINIVRNMDKKVNKNITSKVIFKHMDILDIIKKVLAKK
jgi:hypothetical protein